LRSAFPIALPIFTATRLSLPLAIVSSFEQRVPSYTSRTRPSILSGRTFYLNGEPLSPAG